jgi:hypothetical protein
VTMVYVRRAGRAREHGEDPGRRPDITFQKAIKIRRATAP